MAFFTRKLTEHQARNTLRVDILLVLSCHALFLPLHFALATGMLRPSGGHLKSVYELILQQSRKCFEYPAFTFVVKVGGETQ